MVRQAIGVWGALLRRLRVTWQPMLALNLAYAALSFFLLASLPGMLTRGLIRLSGQTALADQDIAYFLLTPFGMASMTLVVAVMIAISALAQTSMMFIGITNETRRMGAREALLFAAARVLPILSFSVRLVARVVLIVAPFLAIAVAIAWLMITQHDINYYLTVRPPAFWVTAFAAGTLAFAMLTILVSKLLSWSLALPLVLFGDISPERSFAQSEQLTQGERTFVLGVLAVWALAGLVLATVALMFVQRLGTWLVPYFNQELSYLVVVLGALVALWAVLNFFATSFSSATFALAIVELSDKLGVPVASGESLASPLLVERRGWKLTGSRIVLLLITGTLIAAITGTWLLESTRMNDDVVIAAHRGAAGKAPENTLAAVRQAIADGAAWIEIDVQETRDGAVVVVHDSDFMKLADVELKVWDGTLEQIRAIDVGSWFSPEFVGEQVPTLREVLEEARDKALVLIELKHYGHARKLEQRVVDIVEAADMVSQVSIMSLEFESIEKVRALRPDWTIGLVSATAIGHLSEFDADFLAVNLGMADASFLRAAHQTGKQVFVWTVNDPVSVSRVVSLGVDGVITDEPEMARRVLDDRADMNPAQRLLMHTVQRFGHSTPKDTRRDHSP